MSSRRERERDREREEEEEDDPSRYPKYMSITGEPLQLDLDKSFLGKCRHIDEFESLNQLGEGTYGVVRRARDRKITNRTDKHTIVALKQVRIFDEDRNNGIPITALREIFLLRDLKHRNVVRVLDVAVGDELHDVYMVMEYAEQDLANLLDYARVNYSQSEVKCLAKQLFEGLEYLHDRNVIHRDIKASNLLLTAKGILKIADFGLAREYSERPLTPSVVTVWYRSPELLLGASRYTQAVDIWAAGMVIGEIIKQVPLCPGENEIDQLNKIAQLLGVPNDRIWPKIHTMPSYHQLKYRIQNPQRQNQLEILFLGITSSATVNLINSCLTYDPEKRITARQCLSHEYFREAPAPKETSMMPTFPESRNSGNNNSGADGGNDTIAVHGKRAGGFDGAGGSGNGGYVFDFDGQFGGMPQKKRHRHG
ncbi:hypothetical protein TWF106_004609 [Orbilia oligospora]|uniref:cyclin-dependent kinase n=1 Tax=Orbilia oligospora TaxID=2813651 RepID=A0A7C8U416_ORBOL|nr:hypothetical protein TWF106_004609 [Orbilia oligospora]